MGFGRLPHCNLADCSGRKHSRGHCYRTLDCKCHVPQNPRMKTVFAVAALLVLSCVRADEFEPPYFKDGLWQANTSRTSEGKTTQTSMKLCQNHETQKKDRDFSASLRKRSQCTFKVSHPTANSYVTEDQCAAGPSPASTSKTTITFQGDTTYRMEMHRVAGTRESIMIIDAKYLGSCPVDMKPGDAVMADGTKMNTAQ
jgi:hypothetical protein